MRNALTRFDLLLAAVLLAAVGLGIYLISIDLRWVGTHYVRPYAAVGPYALVPVVSAVISAVLTLVADRD
jgi:hypothetical protein